MKRNLLSLFILFFAQGIKAQEFSFQLNFIDAIGNKDSLVLGYDITASDTIDSSFSELNIISTPLDTAFDIRVSDVYTNLFSSSSFGTYQSKKQLVKNTNNCEFTTIAIEVFAKYWPITATWNNTLFADSCSEGSFLTSVHPGGWWDVASTSNLYRTKLALNNSITFSSNNDGNLSIPFLAYNSGAYLNSNNDTISVFWLKFGDSTILNTSINNNQQEFQYNIYPNPANETLHVSIDKNIKLTNTQLSIINISGSMVLKESILSHHTELTINHLPNGIYFLKIDVNNEKSILKKISIIR
ncbi:MAG TPA: T9SS type A sorting domain-containing protein [Vicingus sp.]|nr:T9SS type A sorting domain-containing protein [Vicingus sp.]